MASCTLELLDAHTLGDDLLIDSVLPLTNLFAGLLATLT